MKVRLMVNGLGHAFNDPFMFIIPLLLPLLEKNFILIMFNPV